MSVSIAENVKTPIEQLVFEDRPVYFIGDIHGFWNLMFNRINNYDLHDCYLISVGDTGIGFCSSFEEEMNLITILNDIFAERNIIFLSIRGNHDDPKYFNNSVNKSNFKLLKDYTVLTINSQKYLFVGGSLSIDRWDRLKDFDYWSDEAFVLDESKAVPCDVLVTHSAPSWNGPNDRERIAYHLEQDLIYQNGIINDFDKKTTDLWSECLKDRADHDRLIELTNPSQHFAGHFHLSSYTKYKNTQSHILDRLEFFELINVNNLVINS